ncbi:MAG: hypothetical protein IT367_14045 [Candidatus Hydrogenedentes bacterium]|nr:hypothetical protein [Candidatus Hydrogenedentota bacterium]
MKRFFSWLRVIFIPISMFFWYLTLGTMPDDFPIANQRFSTMLEATKPYIDPALLAVFSFTIGLALFLIGPPWNRIRAVVFGGVAPANLEEDANKWNAPKITNPKLSENVEAKIEIKQAPGQIFARFTNLTTHQQENLSKDYENKWVKWSGSFGDIRKEKGYRNERWVIYLRLDDKGDKGLFAYINDGDYDKISHTQKGDQVTVYGKISRVTDGYISLENCDIVDQLPMNHSPQGSDTPTSPPQST